MIDFEIDFIFNTCAYLITSSAASAASTTSAGLVHLDLLAINGSPVQLLDSRISLGGFAHGYERVTLVRDVDIVHLADFAEGILQNISGTVAIDAIDEKLPAVGRHAAADASQGGVADSQ